MASVVPTGVIGSKLSHYTSAYVNIHHLNVIIRLREIYAIILQSYKSHDCAEMVGETYLFLTHMYLICSDSNCTICCMDGELIHLL